MNPSHKIPKCQHVLGGKRHARRGHAEGCLIGIAEKSCGKGQSN